MLELRIQGQKGRTREYTPSLNGEGAPELQLHGNFVAPANHHDHDHDCRPHVSIIVSTIVSRSQHGVKNFRLASARTHRPPDGRDTLSSHYPGSNPTHNRPTLQHAACLRIVDHDTLALVGHMGWATACSAKEEAFVQQDAEQADGWQSAQGRHSAGQMRRMWPGEEDECAVPLLRAR